MSKLVDQDGRKFAKLAAELALCYVEIYQCQHCGHPVKGGYCCCHCGSDSPTMRHQEPVMVCL